MNKNLNSVLRNGLVLILLVFFQHSVFGQHEPGPYSFNPYIGNLVWMDGEESTLTSRTITMNNLQPLDNEQDGLIVVFQVHLRSEDEMLPLVAFSILGAQGSNLIEIYYSKSTVTIRRFFHTDGQRKHYDYHLFDPLFVFSGERNFEFRTYFTSNFMYLVSKDLECNPGYLMSPVYFGLDQGITFSQSDSGTQQGFSNMGVFIQRSSNAAIKIGDTTGKRLPYISSTQIFGLRYGDWWQQMQSGFSSPNPAELPN
ncbi:hypothetical protein [Sphingobacterium haloxyli]|uniref:Uncharacterized protein n=1 Tax=Sphingobacterium haloxyli TaxID=2100533 RepID=A0A2S9J4X2_9SPHI|nr:hypothetical protein [Sphingobacterium haloxyli]PRD47779.1 hypothetical protein C5745_07635 [Sphingobacterium haloxyli]